MRENRLFPKIPKCRFSEVKRTYSVRNCAEYDKHPPAVYPVFGRERSLIKSNAKRVPKVSDRLEYIGRIGQVRKNRALRLYRNGNKFRFECSVEVVNDGREPENRFLVTVTGTRISPRAINRYPRRVS